jgi:small-conductance mechanosensitive channel
MVLAQASLTPVPINITTSNSNYTFIRGLTPAAYVVTAINLLLGLAGVASFIFLLWGGIQWITAGGDKDALDKARKRITQALIGLAIVFSAYALIYIVRILFNVDIIGFNLQRMNTY